MEKKIKSPHEGETSRGRNIVELEGVVIDVVASLAKNPHEGEAPLA